MAGPVAANVGKSAVESAGSSIAGSVATGADVHEDEYDNQSDDSVTGAVWSGPHGGSATVGGAGTGASGGSGTATGRLLRSLGLREQRGREESLSSAEAGWLQPAVPLHERFSAGGGASGRGFASGGIGARGSQVPGGALHGDALGSHAYAGLGLKLSFPPILPLEILLRSGVRTHAWASATISRPEAPFSVGGMLWEAGQIARESVIATPTASDAATSGSVAGAAHSVGSVSSAQAGPGIVRRVGRALAAAAVPRLAASVGIGLTVPLSASMGVEVNYSLATRANEGDLVQRLSLTVAS